MTDKKAIAANKNDAARVKADYDVAKARSDELVQDYKNKVEERDARLEEEAFQKSIDAEFKKRETLATALENAENNLKKYTE